MPWTMTFIIRKRQQIDGFNEIPKDKRPPDKIIWWGTPEEIEEWMEKVYPSRGKKEEEDGINMIIRDEEIG
jgi:hypothetical protein